MIKISVMKMWMKYKHKKQVEKMQMAQVKSQKKKVQSGVEHAIKRRMTREDKKYLKQLTTLELVAEENPEEKEPSVEVVAANLMLA